MQKVGTKRLVYEMACTLKML